MQAVSSVFLATVLLSGSVSGVRSVLLSGSVSGVRPDTEDQDHPPGTDAAADFAIDLHNRLNHYEYAFRVMSVLSERVQLYPPARVKFSMAVRVGETVCRNQPGVHLPSCPFQELPDMHIMTCRFVVLCVPNSPVPSRLLEDQCVTEAGQRAHSDTGSKL